MGRRIDELAGSAVDAEREYRAFRERVLDIRVGVASLAIGTPAQRARHARVRRMSHSDERRMALEALGLEVLGEDLVERHVRAMVAARSGWAPADDWSVSGPFAAPAALVAEHRDAFLRGRDE